MRLTEQIKAAAQGSNLVRGLAECIEQQNLTDQRDCRISAFQRRLSAFLQAPVADEDIWAVFLSLEELELGEIKYRGRVAYFSWTKVSMLEFSQLVMGGEKAMFIAEDERNEQLHSLRLRHNYLFEVALPSDFSEEQAERMQMLVQAMTVPRSGVVTRNELRVINFPLSRNHSCELELPSNLSRVESERLREFIGSLPLEREDYWNLDEEEEFDEDE